jgi:hypothetical protein
MTLPPIRRSVSVSWDQDAAFRRFTADFGAWWPTRSHSIGGERVRRVAFEPRVGVLNVWAGRRTARMALLDVVVAIIGLVQRLRGGVDGEIARAGGELPRV